MLDKKQVNKFSEERMALLNAWATTEMDHLKEKTIVIIDDSEEAINIMKAFLKQKDSLQLKTFTDEFLALKAISKENPDLVIMDIMLKSLDGLKMAKIIKEIYLSNTPILFVSSDSTFEKEITTLFDKKSHFIQKPINRTQFIEIVTKLLT